jgi:predicted SnoaL-like aldol condensation-catalyzing enzyme
MSRTPQEQQALDLVLEMHSQVLGKVKVESPHAKHHSKRVLVDGDLVAVHVHVEHWDVLPEVPVKAVNPNSMF